MVPQPSGVGGLGVVDLVFGTGPVVQFVLWTLVAFSIGSWGIILYKLRQISQARRQSQRFTAICPFIGLFGTACGIVTTFLGLSAARPSYIQAAALGIAAAVITTAVALIAAIPAQMFYKTS